jgi:hypothetical protein
MGDHSTETFQQLQSRHYDDEKYARERLLGGRHLQLVEDSMHWILNHIDCFAYQSRGNKKAENVSLSQYSVDGQDDEKWDKVGQAIGNLQSLEMLRISSRHDYPDWEILARILRHVRQNVTLLLAEDSDIACMLQENTSLEKLSIRKSLGRIKTIEAEEYIALVTALQNDRTLKMLSLCRSAGSIQLTDNEDKQVAALVKNNYALESLSDINEARDVGAILRLNGAGRRYLIEGDGSISKGVKVLSAVRDDINCVFLHLLENPKLCDASDTGSTDHGGSTSLVRPTSIGKREGHGRAPNEGKESRSRLASPKVSCRGSKDR